MLYYSNNVQDNLGRFSKIIFFDFYGDSIN